jgi:6,7-dimethyl-8-ribityllumazine synthase
MRTHGLHTKVLSTSGAYDTIVAAGLVVCGGISQHHFVAQTVIHGFMRVKLATGVPIFSVAPTPHHFHAGKEHRFL